MNEDTQRLNDTPQAPSLGMFSIFNLKPPPKSVLVFFRFAIFDLW
jgi:hypothetical protein